METTNLEDNVGATARDKTPTDVLKGHIETYCKAFSSVTEGIEDLSKRSGVSTRTLWRLIAENPKRPYVSTVISLFKVFLGTQSYESVIQNIDPLLKQYVLRNVDTQFDEDSILDAPEAFSRDIKNDSVFRQILVLVQTRDVTIEEIRDQFGAYGVSLLESLESYGMVSVRDGLAVKTDKRVEIDFEATYKISCDLINNYYSISPTQDSVDTAHFILFGRLNKSAYDEIIRIDKKAYEEKRKIFAEKSNAGQIPTWTISAVGTTLKESNKRVLQ